MAKTGIVKSKTDYLQPYRVWYNGKIVFFAQTKEEALLKLEKEKQRRRNKDRLLKKEI